MNSATSVAFQPQPPARTNGHARRNAEGSVLAAREFAAHVIDRVVTSEPVQAAGAAVLRLAWRHRDTLIG